MSIAVNGRRVLVLGLGLTGRSMAGWLVRQGAQVSVADTRSAPPQLAEFQREFPDVNVACGKLDAACLHAAELIAISPGIDQRNAAIADAVKRGIPVVGDIELFAQALKRGSQTRTDTAQVIAITGTNGKSTVTSMVGEVCQAAGLATVVAGNIGTPVLDTLSANAERGIKPDAYVLELSSFQLDSTASLNADAATVLNVTEDHLDRYDGIEDYAASKARVYQGEGVQVVNRDDARSTAMARPGRRIYSFGLDAPRSETEWGIIEHSGQAWLACGSHRLMPVSGLAVAGMHNAANALAAAALCHAAGIEEAIVTSALRAFRGLPHRVERIAVARGLTFYDDSKGTNVGATAAALAGFDAPVVLIAGGDGKQQDFGPLREPVKRHARAVILIGRDREQIATALAGCGVPIERAHDMQEAVVLAAAASRSGDGILLSPACASFDMYRDYLERSAVFVAAVQSWVAQ